MDFILRHLQAGDISLIELYSQEGAGRKPLVLMLHGYLCQKEQHLAHAYNLARHGFFVVLPDCYGHGERNASGVTPTFFEAALKTTEEIHFLMERYEKDERVDTLRIGLTGFSMGGCITFNYLAGGNKRIKAAAAVIATPDWASIMETEAMHAELKASGLVKSEEEIAEYERTARQVQPLNTFTAMKDTPLLILNGGKDPIIPIEKVRSFFERLQPLYSCKEDIKLSVYEDMGHMDNVPMNMELARWFVKYL